jgi:hypothetical protein
MSFCVIHFPKVDAFLPLIQFTSFTLDRVKERRNQSLHLDGERKEIAEKSLEFLTIKQEHLCFENDSPPFFYHKECYRRFTDKTKMERATTRLKKANLKINEQIVNQEDKLRPLTRSLIDKPESVKANQQEKPFKPATGKDILPKICIICKKLENYFTHPVSLIIILLTSMFA